MEETQKQTRKIDWQKSSRILGQMVWGVGTYLGVLIGIGCLAAAGSSEKASVALFAVFYSTAFHWLVFTVIERKDNK